jgi:uncharacterized membrane protein/predicted DsbA family dithiol-disulfide isomerase
MLLVDHIAPHPAFCGVGSACAEVRRSEYAQVFDLVPLPVAGVLGLFTLLLLTLARRRRPARSLAAILSLVAAVTGATLLVLQVAVIGAICGLCTIVDLACVVVGALALPWLRQDQGLAETRGGEALARWAWVSLAVFAVLAPIVWSFSRPLPPLPPGLAALRADSGVTVLEAMDFECPHCRALHPRLAALARAAPDVHLVRVHYPLAAHAHARDAAIAHLCATARGVGDAMADALVSARRLDRGGIDAAAAAVGIDAATLDACRADPARSRALEAHRRAVDEAGFIGLPTTWIGRRRILGARPTETFASTIRDARAGTEGVGVPWWASLLAAAMFLAVVIRLGRRT